MTRDLQLLRLENELRIFEILLPLGHFTTTRKNAINVRTNLSMLN